MGAVLALLVYLVPVLLGLSLFYWIVRRAVRDGILEARRLPQAGGVPPRR